MLARTMNAETTNKYLTIVCGIHEQILNHYLIKFVDTPFQILNISLKVTILFFFSVYFDHSHFNVNSFLITF